MRKEALRHSSLPCDPLESDQFDEETYRVASTDAFANLSSSISLIHLYCSRLPADGLVISFFSLIKCLISFILGTSDMISLLHSGCFVFILFFIIYLIWVELSGTLNQLQGGTKRRERCICPRAAR